MTRILPSLLIAALAAPCAAQDAPAPDPAAGIEINLEPGAYVRPYRHYDVETNTIEDGPTEGAEELCLRIIGPDPEGLRVLHANGVYTPEWSDTPIEPGGIDVWFSSDTYIEKNPGADRLTLLKLIWRNVPDCTPDPPEAEAAPKADSATTP